jgi:hypothetical protein
MTAAVRCASCDALRARVLELEARVRELENSQRSLGHDGGGLERANSTIRAQQRWLQVSLETADNNSHDTIATSTVERRSVAARVRMLLSCCPTRSVRLKDDQQLAGGARQLALPLQSACQDARASSSYAELCVPSTATTATSASVTGAQPPASESAPDTDGWPLLCVMRHSTRLDAHEAASIGAAAWPDRLTRPYDTPIADLELPRRAARRLRAAGLGAFDVVVSSPYRRCLQTAAIVAEELSIACLVIDNRLSEDLTSAERCWAAHGLPIGEYTYMSLDEATKWATADAPGGGGGGGGGGSGGSGISHVTWQRDLHQVLRHPDSVSERVCAFPLVGAHAAQSVHAPPSSARVLMVTHGDLINAFAPGFDWDPGIGRYRADECGWLACRGMQPLDAYDGDTVPLEQVPRVIAADGLSAM